MKTQFRNLVKTGGVSLIVATCIAALSAQAAGRNPNPGILPTSSNPYGKAYSEWVVQWWQWAFSIPADRNPLTDETGAFCGEAQSGPVWFVAGTLGNSVTRSCSVPSGKALFMPVFNWIFGAGVFDCEPTVPGVPCDIPTLQAAAAANTEAAEVLEVWIDGVPVQNVRGYRAASPGDFSVTYPENSLVGVPAGTYAPNVADGYWLMLSPLSKGAHTIHAHVVAPGTIFGLIQYDLVVQITVD